MPIGARKGTGAGGRSLIKYPDRDVKNALREPRNAICVSFRVVFSQAGPTLPNVMSSADKRPDPDALLASLKQEEARAARGRLKVYLGMCPGVGKTYTMLGAAQKERANGVDVVVGVVETHGRAET